MQNGGCSLAGSETMRKIQRICQKKIILEISYILRGESNIFLYRPIWHGFGRDWSEKTEAQQKAAGNWSIVGRRSPIVCFEKEFNARDWRKRPLYAKFAIWLASWKVSRLQRKFIMIWKNWGRKKEAKKLFDIFEKLIKKWNRGRSKLGKGISAMKREGVGAAEKDPSLLFSNCSGGSDQGIFFYFERSGG